MQKVLYGVGAFVALILLGGFLLPSHSRFVVTADIDAPRATVFALVNSMRRQDLWAPVAVTDPNAKVVFSGHERGLGSTITWDGIIVGSGTQSITASQPNEFVETTINAGDAGESRTWFELEDGIGFTRVRWGFEHDYGLNVIGRYFGIMVSGIIRKEFEASVENLRDLAESLPRADFADIKIERLVVEPVDIAYVRTTSAPAPGATSAAMGAAFFEVLNFIDAHGLAEAGAPMSIARAFSGAELRFDSAIPVRGVSASTPRKNAGVRLGRTYGGTIIRVRHVGSYRTLSSTHRKIVAYLAALDIKRNGDSWESYVSDPTKMDEADLLTYVYYPIKDQK